MLSARKLFAPKLSNRLFQPHPDPSLNRHWAAMQLSLIVLPFSTLLGCVLIFLTSIAIWRKYANALVQQLVNQILLLLGVWMIIIALFAFNVKDALVGIVHFFPFFIVFIAQSYLLQSIEQLRRIAWLIALMSIPVIAIGLGQLYLGWSGRVQVAWLVIDWYIGPGGAPPGRMSSVFFYATWLASYFIITFTMSLGLWLEAWRFSPAQARSQRWWVLLLLSFLTLANGAALILTNSRNAWALALLAVVSLTVFVGYRFMLGISASVAVAIAEAAFAPPPLRDWFRVVVPRFFWARINDEMFTNRNPAELRTTQWEFAYKMIQWRPLTGWGLRNFSALYKNAMNGFYIGHPHNLPLMLMAETGIPATILFISTIGWILFKAVRWLQVKGRAAIEADRLIYFTFFVTFVECSLFCTLDIPFFDARINALNWLILAALWGVSQRRQLIASPASSAYLSNQPFEIKPSE